MADICKAKICSIGVEIICSNINGHKLKDFESEHGLDNLNDEIGRDDEEKTYCSIGKLFGGGLNGSRLAHAGQICVSGDDNLGQKDEAGAGNGKRKEAAY